VDDLEQARKVSIENTLSNKYDTALLNTKQKQATKVRLTQQVVKQVGDGYLPGNYFKQKINELDVLTYSYDNLPLKLYETQYRMREEALKAQIDELAKSYGVKDSKKLFKKLSKVKSSGMKLNDSFKSDSFGSSDLSLETTSPAKTEVTLVPERQLSKKAVDPLPETESPKKVSTLAAYLAEQKKKKEA
jgi:hypothetical protein